MNVKTVKSILLPLAIVFLSLFCLVGLSPGQDPASSTPAPSLGQGPASSAPTLGQDPSSTFPAQVPGEGDREARPESTPEEGQGEESLAPVLGEDPRSATLAPGPSQIEQILSGRFPTDISRTLRQFGYDYFVKRGPGFTPLANIPVGPDYIIGPDDSLVINLWGKTELSYSTTVNRDGSIYIPRLGTLNIAGLTFDGLKGFLNRKFREYYTDFEMSINMTTLRTIDIFVVGEAQNPGTFSLSSLSSAVTALFDIGGPTKKGTLRDIQVIRNGQTLTSIDLYEFFIKGVKKKDVRLQSGDTIFIPVIGPVVGIAGGVRRPAIYELKEEQTIGELIELAGGILSIGHLQNVVMERVTGHQRRVVKSFNLDPAHERLNENLQARLQDTDLVKIYPIYKGMGKVVYLEGHVKYPREHEWRPGLRLLDIIPSHEYLLSEPYLPQAEITRQIPPSMHTEIIEFNLGALLAGSEKDNLLLEDQDRIRIFSKWAKQEVPEVFIKGAVLNPGTYRLHRGMTVKDLIFRAGNLTENAYRESATLTRIVKGEEGAESIRITLYPAQIMDNVPQKNILLERNDVVHIRQIPKYSQMLSRRIYVEGEVFFPGEYTFAEGERLVSVLDRAGGLTNEAYARGAVFLRESVKTVQRERLNEYIRQLETDILSLTAEEAEISADPGEAQMLQQTVTLKQQLLQRLRTSEPTGRMIINLEEVLWLPTSKYNFELRPGDRLVVHKRPDHINVLGEVYNQTAIFYEPGQNVKHYLSLVGGLTDNANKRQLYVVRADGTVISKRQSGFGGLVTWDRAEHRWTTGSFESIELYPGDTIIAPRKIDTYRWARIGKDISQILYQLAVTAGVLKSSLGLF